MTTSTMTSAINELLASSKVSENMKKHIRISLSSTTEKALIQLDKYVKSYSEVKRDKYAIRKYCIIATMIDKSRKASVKDSFHVIAETIAHFAERSEELTNRRIFINAQHKTRRQADMTFKVLENLSCCERFASSESTDVDNFKLTKNSKIVRAILKHYVIQ